MAGYDDYQMRWVVCRPRNKYGGLTRTDDELPPWVEVDDEGMRVVSNPVPFGAMFRQVGKRAGLKAEEIEAKYRAYRAANPEMDRKGVQ